LTAPPVALLAGGLATRMGGRCRETPKALLEVAGVPFAHRQLELLKKNGLEKAVFLAGFLGGMIQESVGDGSRFGLSVGYSFDWPDLLGTGGAIVKALPLLGEKFMVLYGDSYLDIDYRAVAKAFADSGMPALMTVHQNEDNYDRSNVVFEDGRIRLYDKMNRSAAMRHIDYGLGCFQAAAFEGRSGKFDLADVYRDLSVEGRLAGYLAEKRFYEIGSPGGLAELDALFRAGKSEARGPRGPREPRGRDVSEGD
jgi:NDP-sugar pyrophosphorylase family protein